MTMIITIAEQGLLQCLIWPTLLPDLSLRVTVDRELDIGYIIKG